MRRHTITPFDYINNIRTGKQKLDIDKTEYKRFLINRGMSLHSDTLTAANYMNLNSHISNEMHYDFLFHAVRKFKRQWATWPKEPKDEDLAAVQEYYGYNRRKAQQALAILKDDELAIIKESINKGGLKNERTSRDTS